MHPLHPGEPSCIIHITFHCFQHPVGGTHVELEGLPTYTTCLKTLPHQLWKQKYYFFTSQCRQISHSSAQPYCSVCSVNEAPCSVLFSQGVCMIIGGLRHSEQRFNSRSTGVSSALLFISVGGKYHLPVQYVHWVCMCFAFNTCTNSQLKLILKI